jgi:DNA-binding Lrp family transcriptional regulator
MRGSGALPRQARRPRLSENIEAISQIKQLWSRNTRPSQREIAKQIGYPASSAKYFIKKMLESGELEA